MSVPYTVIFCLIQSTGYFFQFLKRIMTRSSVAFSMCILIYWCIFTVLASSCSVNDFDIAADNAVITCMTNVSCEAGCYRGYIFPNGRTNESYICQDELWTPVISTCKRNYLFFFFKFWVKLLYNPFNFPWYYLTFLDQNQLFTGWLRLLRKSYVLLVWFSKLSIEKLISLLT